MAGIALPLDREEYVEQAYFFRLFRERLAENRPSQEILQTLDREILAHTRLPMAIPFLAGEMKHHGSLAGGIARLPHYFTAFQAFTLKQAEKESQRFRMDLALLVLEHEATFKSESPTREGLFLYQFETICRNRLGYDDGFAAIALDPAYDADWKAYLSIVRRQVGIIDTADLIYLRSQAAIMDRRRTEPSFEPNMPPLFGEKEGRIARACRGRDPLYLFAAMQRQLRYPEVPRHVVRETESGRIDALQEKLRIVEARLKLVEGESRGNVDWSTLARPEAIPKLDD